MHQHPAAVVCTRRVTRAPCAACRHCAAPAHTGPCEALGRPARSSAYLLGENDDQPEMSVVANLVDERDALLAALKASLAWHDSLDCRQSTTDKLKLDMAAVIRRAEGRA